MSDETSIIEQREVDALAYEIPEDRGYSAKVWYLKNTTEHKGDALIVIYRNGNTLRKFLFPAYRIWNIAAHFSDIVDGEIAESDRGYRMAAWNGLGEL